MQSPQASHALVAGATAGRHLDGVTQHGDSGLRPDAGTIVGFARNDLIDLTAVDADAALDGDQAFARRGGGASSLRDPTASGRPRDRAGRPCRDP